MKRLLDKSFKYVHSSKTDLKKTFARIRREQEEAKREQVVIVAKRQIGKIK